MLHIDIIALGSVREKFFQEACLEYLKRNRKYYCIQVLEIKEEAIPSHPSKKEVQECLEKESKKVLESLKPNTYPIGLAPQGSSIQSEKFAEMLIQLPLKGFSHCTFVIGSSYGLSASFLQQCQLNLSFSSLTFPHQLFRVILLEQLYRAAKINHKEVYHK